MANLSIDAKDIQNYVRQIRSALVIGLASFGEIERLKTRYDCLKLCNFELDKGLQPQHATGASSSAGDFAEAFALLGILEDDALKSEAVG